MLHNSNLYLSVFGPLKRTLHKIEQHLLETYLVTDKLFMRLLVFHLNPGVFDPSGSIQTDHLLDELQGVPRFEPFYLRREQALLNQLQVQHIIYQRHEQIYLSNDYNHSLASLGAQQLAHQHALKKSQTNAEWLAKLLRHGQLVIDRRSILCTLSCVRGNLGGQKVL